MTALSFFAAWAVDSKRTNLGTMLRVVAVPPADVIVVKFCTVKITLNELFFDPIGRMPTTDTWSFKK